ncbi:MAG: tetratricopeptide repeat protein [Acidobacteriota bacterium]|nr:tetratricopeptide repeat protein [Acidobacteriota bacterium]
MKSLQREISRSLVEALDREIRSRGRGAISKLEQALGQSTGWWLYHANSGNLNLHCFLAALDHLGLDPVLFIRRHLDDDDTLHFDRPQGPAPELVAVAKKRFREQIPGTGVGKALLESLDERRRTEPEKAFQLALMAVEHVELELLPMLCGVIGSALRLLLRLDEAAHWLQLGLRETARSGDILSHGHLLRRYSYVLMERTELPEAVRAAEKATLLLLQAGDEVGSAKGWVEQGMWYLYLNRNDSSKRCLELALNYLPSEEQRYRCTAHHCLGLVAQQQGDLETALRYIKIAASEAPDKEKRDRAKFLWLAGRIQADLGEVEAAITTLSKAIRILHDLHPGEAALATCDLVATYLRAGRCSEAFTTAHSMVALLEPLKKNRIVSRAIAELLRAGKEGLSLALIERVTTRIEGERKKPKTWRQLRLSSKAA